MQQSLTVRISLGEGNLIDRTQDAPELIAGMAVILLPAERFFAGQRAQNQDTRGFVDNGRKTLLHKCRLMRVIRHASQTRRGRVSGSPSSTECLDYAAPEV